MSTSMYARPLILLLAATLGAAACKDKNTPTLVAKRSALGDSADQVIFGLVHALTAGGIRRGELRADTAFFYDDMQRIEMRKVTAYSFDRSGAKAATMTGDRGNYDLRTQKIEGSNVVLSTVDGRTLKSPHLVWDRGLNQVTSDTTFSFTSPGRNMSGVGFRSDPQLRNFSVLSQARGGSVLPAGGLSSKKPATPSTPPVTPPSAQPTTPSAAPPTTPAPTTTAPPPAVQPKKP